MNAIARYDYFYKEINIIIDIRKISSAIGETVYFAKSNFKNISAMAECEEKALENCVKRIKFAFLLLEKKVRLIDQDQAILLAKKHFQEYNKELFKRYEDRLSYSVFVEDEIMTFDVLASEYKKLNKIAVIYVNLITGECDVVKSSNRKEEYDISCG